MDYSALMGINDHLSGHTWLAHTLALFSAASPIIVVALLVGAWLSVRPGSASRLRQGVAGAVVAAGLALGTNSLISHVWARPRPSVAHPGSVHLWFTGPSADPSFPSDHASAAFAVAFAILMVSRRFGLIMILLAGAIAISRVAIGLHYPGDVLAGAVVGLFAALVVMRLLDRPLSVATRYASRLTDRLVAPVWAALDRRRHVIRAVG